MSLSKTTKQRVLGYFFAFLAALFTTLLVAVCIVAGTLCNESYLLNHMEKSQYYHKAAQVLTDQYAAYGLPAGIEESFFESAIDEDTLYLDIRGMVKASYTGTTYTIDKKALSQTLYNQLLAYAEKKGGSITDQVKTNLTHLSDLCIEAYQKQADQSLLRMMGQYTYRFRTVAWAGIAVLVLLDVLCIAMIFRLSAFPHRALRSLNSACLGAGLMLIAYPAWLYLSGGVERLGITSPSLYALMVSYTNSLFSAFLISGAVLIVTVITVGIIGVKLVKKHSVF